MDKISTGQAAEIVGVSAVTIRNWIAAGKLKATRIGLRNDYLLNRRDVERLAVERSAA